MLFKRLRTSVQQRPRHGLHEMTAIAFPCIISGDEGCTGMQKQGRARSRFMKIECRIAISDALSSLFNASSVGASPVDPGLGRTSQRRDHSDRVRGLGRA